MINKKTSQDSFHQHHQQINDNFNLVIQYALCHTPFGPCLAACTDRHQLCYLAFLAANSAITTHDLAELRDAWPRAVLHPAPSLYGCDCVVAAAVDRLFANKSPLLLSTTTTTADNQVLIRGTPFEMQVWHELTANVPAGSTITYSELAAAVGRPRAVRATARAVAKNRVAYAIPCHRVISKDCARIYKYRWGAEIKRKLLEYERKQQTS